MARLHTLIVGLAAVALLTTSGCWFVDDSDGGEPLPVITTTDTGTANGGRDTGFSMSDAAPEANDDTGGGGSDPDTGDEPSTDTGDEPSTDTGGDPSRDTGPTCGAGLRACGGSCVDPSTSDRHCGSCGNRCSGARSCQNGACRCPGGQSWCGGACTDTSSDSQHCGSCGNACGGGETCSSGSCQATGKVAGVINETNSVRSTMTDCGSEGSFQKKPPLMGNKELHRAAQRHADDMVMNNFFDHTGSDGSNFAERIRDTNFKGRPVGENIAAGNSTAASTVQQWEDSDGHCRNMMNGDANTIGVGVARGARYGWYWVQVFGAL